jgi:hypothetical protein
MNPTGCAVLTVPHRNAYFSYDDTFVGHYRRYEIRELAGLLDSAGFSVTGIEKILGPVEKAAMLIATRLYAELSIRKPESRISPTISHPAALQCLDGLFEFANTVFMAIAWLDARIFPRTLSTVLLLTMVKV